MARAKDADQPKLVEVAQEVSEWEFKIQGAHGFQGGEDLELHDDVVVVLTGSVKGDATVLRRRMESGAGSEEEELVRVVTIKAKNATIKSRTPQS